MIKDSRIGIQVFKHILSTIDNSLVVEEVISSTSTGCVVQFCGVKWVAVGQVISLNGDNYTVQAVDIINSTVTFSKTHGNLPAVGDVMLIPDPGFISGTQLAANEDQSIKVNAGVPILVNNVWLIEPIVGEVPRYGSSDTYTFSFTFFTLKHMPVMQMLNEQRHDEGIFPASQLGHAIINAVDSSSGMTRSGRVPFRELSRFGKETESGVESYLLSLDLTGVRYKMDVEVEDWLICQC